MPFSRAKKKVRLGKTGARMTLETNSIRVTPQRIVILTILEDADDHPDAPELHRRAKVVDAAISLATVYRNLAVLETAGLVERHCFEGGGARFETAAASHHDHIVDLETSDVVEFRSEEIEQLQRDLAAALGYEVVHHRLELYCRKIREK